MLVHITCNELPTFARTQIQWRNDNTNLSEELHTFSSYATLQIRGRAQLSTDTLQAPKSCFGGYHFSSSTSLYMANQRTSNAAPGPLPTLLHPQLQHLIVDGSRTTHVRNVQTTSPLSLYLSAPQHATYSILPIAASTLPKCCDAR